MTVAATEPYPDPAAVRHIDIPGGGTLSIRFTGDVQDVLDGVINALLCYGVRGRYDSLAEAVQALGRRAEAAEAQDVEVDPDEVLLDVVRAAQGELSVTPEEIALVAVKVRQTLLRRYRLVPLGE